ncbi:hypothetical protein KKH13_05190 [Patescibacteria group bacterium]|nr:hypothetical protein [Patescibacteria group bacterium]
MDTSDVRYKKIVEEFANDPEFLQLSDMDQDSIIDTAVQKRYGAIPNAGNLLQRAMQSARGYMGAPSFIPTTSQEVQDIPKIGTGILEDISTLPGASEVYSEMPMGEKDVQPKTPWGKGMKSSVEIAPLAYGGIKTVEGIGKLGKSFLGVKHIGKEINETAYTGAKQAKESVGKLFKEYNKKFGEGLKNIEGTMHSDSIAKALARTSDEFGAIDIPGTRGNKISGLADEVLNLDKELDANEVQNQVKVIMKKLGNDDVAVAKFYKNLSDITESELPELSALKKSHAPIYKKAEMGSKLTKGSIKRSSKEDISPSELKDLKESEQAIGINPITKSEKLGNRMRRNKGIRDIIKWGTVAGGGTALINKFLK